jgi:hypothetical protein
MNLLTHIAISKILYDHFKGQMKLDRRAFIYGNIKPDLSWKSMSKAHIMENYHDYVCNSSCDLMKNGKSHEEFSVELGQICHYVCDFFCKYHLNKEIFHSLGGHFLHELRLQYELWKLTGKGKLELDIYSWNARGDIASILFQMRSDYFYEAVNINKDIYYAISAAIWVCESVARLMAQSVEPTMENEVELYTMLPLAGGQ